MFLAWICPFRLKSILACQKNTGKLDFLEDRFDNLASDYVVNVGGRNGHTFNFGFVSHEVDGGDGISLARFVGIHIVSWTQKQFCCQRPWGLLFECLLLKMVGNACTVLLFVGIICAGRCVDSFRSSESFAGLLLLTLLIWVMLNLLGKFKNGRLPISDGKRILQTRIR